MHRKLFVLALTLVLVVPNICLAKPYSAYEKDLDRNQKTLIDLEERISRKKTRLKALSKEYNDADMALRMEFINAKKAPAGKELDKQSKKLLIRKAKADQNALRKDYYDKKKPFADRLSELNKMVYQAKRNIKMLEKKLDKISEGYVDNDKYQEEIASLKQELETARSEYNQSLLGIKEQVINDIASISDLSRKSKISKKIKTEAKEKEHKLLKEYQSKKIKIRDKITAAKKENKLLIEKAREKVKKQQLAEKKSVATNEPGGSESTSNFGSR